MAKSMNQVNLELLENIIGSKLYEQVCAAMPGANLYIPDLSPQKRNADIWDDFIHGLLPQQLAEKYKLSQKRIYQILEKKP